MTQRYHHHELWEDWKAGLFAVRYDDPETGAQDAATLLRDTDAFYSAGSAVVREWVHSTEVNLTDLGSNRRAWLGQAACCFALGVPDFVTKRAWWTLTDDEKNFANGVADALILEWEESRAETLFRY